MNLKNNCYNPGDDFYNYVNSEWIKNNPIPEDHQRWSNFNILNERNNNIVKQLIEQSIKSKNMDR